MIHFRYHQWNAGRNGSITSRPVNEQLPRRSVCLDLHVVRVSWTLQAVFTLKYVCTLNSSANNFRCPKYDAISPLKTSQSWSYFTTGGLPSISSSWRQAPWHSRPAFSFQLNTCFHSPYVTPSLMRGWVCHDHILLSQNRDSRNLEGQVPVFISSRNRVSQLYPQALSSLFVASYDSQGGIRPRLHTGYSHTGNTSRLHYKALPVNVV
jgi:hypothetical protein